MKLEELEIIINEISQLKDIEIAIIEDYNEESGNIYIKPKKYITYTTKIRYQIKEIFKKYTNENLKIRFDRKNFEWIFNYYYFDKPFINPQIKNKNLLFIKNKNSPTDNYYQNQEDYEYFKNLILLTEKKVIDIYDNEADIYKHQILLENIINNIDKNLKVKPLYYLPQENLISLEPNNIRYFKHSPSGFAIYENEKTLKEEIEKINSYNFNYDLEYNTFY